MINVTGNGSVTSCDGITRRDFLQVGTLGALGFSMAQYAQLQAKGAVAAGREERSAIMIFNLGAPSQLDTWDMKPDAPREVRGPFQPIRTRSSEFEISEIFPEHAKVANHFSLVRSVYHTAAAVHDTGHQMMQTGRLFTGGVNTPHAGCALEFLKGRRNELPAHVILPEPMGPTGGNLPHGQDAGFLGKPFDPFVLNGDPSQPGFQVPDLLPPEQIGEARLRRRQSLRKVVEDSIQTFESSDAARLMESNFSDAYRLMTSQRAREAFDLSREPDKVRERYGMTRFGQSCLLARRLVEAGVRFVTINTFITVFDEITWDIHGSAPFTSIAGMKDIVAPMYDRAYGALISDLHDRGMLGNTLVCNLAEFGRTPKINPAGGRDHWPQCWTVYFAGGGVRGGQVVGKSDEIGAYPVERPVTPGEIVATIYQSLGLDLETHLPGPNSRPFPLVNFGTKPITELFG
ncbi:MAG: DUF1501 domain-containing protein [Verrucomicrobia bacterium]|jgi:hypothetical protein|nr:DUF1501 domain-containing protein [Verrucomicrobiota bacterium]